jgi:hypothetical protein
MPTLDDAPIVPKLAGASVALTDLVQIYDVSAQRPKTITIAELIIALDALDASQLADDA